MGMALWCDQGEHAFSEKDDSSTLNRKVTVDGVTSFEEMVICSKCLAKMYGEPAAPAQPAISNQGMSDGNYTNPGAQTGMLYGQ